MWGSLRRICIHTFYLQAPPRCLHRHCLNSTTLRCCSFHLPISGRCFSQYQFTPAAARRCRLHGDLGFIWTTPEYWFDSRQQQRIYPFSKATRTGLVSTQPPTEWVTGRLHWGKVAGAWSWPLNSISTLMNLWHGCPKWHEERFPWHAAFTALPIFYLHCPNSGGIVDAIFIFGAPVWRWLGEYVTLVRTFYSLLL
jgi:hypothetical protein